MIGSLLRLIRSSAVPAVLDRSEQITPASLEEVEAGIAAQSARAAGPRTP
jgi:hypothetical protein